MNQELSLYLVGSQNQDVEKDDSSLLSDRNVTLKKETLQYWIYITTFLDKVILVVVLYSYVDLIFV